MLLCWFVASRRPSTVASWMVYQMSLPPYRDSEVGVGVSAQPLPLVGSEKLGWWLGAPGLQTNLYPNTKNLGENKPLLQGLCCLAGIPVPAFTTCRPGHPPFLSPTFMAHSFCEQ